MKVLSGNLKENQWQLVRCFFFFLSWREEVLKNETNKRSLFNRFLGQRSSSNILPLSFWFGCKRIWQYLFLFHFWVLGRRLGVGHSREEMSLRNQSDVWQANRADGVTAAMSDGWSRDVNGGDPDCRVRARGRKRKWNSGRRLAPAEEEALFPCLPARLFRHCSILVPGLRTLPSLNPEPMPLVHHVKTPLRPLTLPPLPSPRLLPCWRHQHPLKLLLFIKQAQLALKNLILEQLLCQRAQKGPKRWSSGSSHMISSIIWRALESWSVFSYRDISA